MIPIQNIYYMLSYAFRVLNQQGYKKLATEKFDNTLELMAEILIKGLSRQIKRGLEREYILQTDDLAFVRGKLEISESLKNNSMLRKKLICAYDDFSVNSTMNKIIKSTVETLLTSNLSKGRKKELRKLMIYFRDVKTINIRYIDWNFKYNRNNKHYQMLIAICYLIVKGLIQTNTDGTMKMMDFLDDQRMSRLYEKFILEYYKKHYPKLSVSASQIPWSLDNGVREMLPIMQSDIYIQNEDSILIIDAKYYGKTTQMKFDKNKIISNNLYQIFTYVKNCNYQFEGQNITVSGMLLYAKTDEDIHPNNIYQMHGNQITVKTLDLNCSFDKIYKQMDSIVESHFKRVKKYE
ncbi:MAG: 5-methylcytosine-specific restriction endonuclease system specificity protein McrC [Parvimonas sp.]|nr:5-methylcytosine-specific restriction endonuclease system specificity protein McrC [Parvimonas sp.]